MAAILITVSFWNTFIWKLVFLEAVLYKILPVPSSLLSDHVFHLYRTISTIYTMASDNSALSSLTVHLTNSNFIPVNGLSYIQHSSFIYCQQPSLTNITINVARCLKKGTQRQAPAWIGTQLIKHQGSNKYWVHTNIKSVITNKLKDKHVTIIGLTSGHQVQ